MKVLVKGPALTRTGYGEHCRFVLRSLRQIDDLDIYLFPVNWGQSAWVWENNEERRWLDAAVKKTAIHNQQGGQYDISIQVTIPNEWEKIAPLNIGVTAGIETTKVSPTWLEKCNQMDKIVTISEHSKKGFVDTQYEGTYPNGMKGLLKCLKDIEVVHYPVKKYENLPNLDLNLSTKFNFLTVAQWGPRKNLGATVQWFVEEFIDNPDVGLVVKTFLKGGCLIDKENIEKQLSRSLEKYENRKCKVYFMHGDLTDEQMHSLYENKNIHALVSLTHGEGFGLPLFEAAYSGLPVIATAWSGHLDFLCKPTKNKKGKNKVRPYFAKIDYDLNPVPQTAVWQGVIEPDSQWAYPQQGSYKMKLREVYKEYGRFKKQAKQLQKWLEVEFEQNKQYEAFTNSISEYVKQFDVEDWLNDLEINDTETDAAA